MAALPRLLLVATFSCVAFAGTSYSAAADQNADIPLVVAAGTPLRVEVDRTFFPKHIGDAIHGRLTEPVYAFDREVLPAGAEVFGHVRGFTKASRGVQIREMMGGHFGSFRAARVQFDSVQRVGEAPLRIDATTDSSASRVVELRATPSSAPSHGLHGVIAQAENEGKREIARARDLWHTPDKSDLVRNALLDVLPYKPVRVEAKSQFDAVLRSDEHFGTIAVRVGEIAALGQVAPQSGELRANLLTPLDSGTSRLDSGVEAIVTSPLFTEDHQLLLPVGTRLLGKVTSVKPAAHMHKNGQLRFSFQQTVLPAEIQRLQQELAQQAQATASAGPGKIQAHLGGIVIIRSSHVGVDEEGQTKVNESKTRFAGPALAIALAAAATQQEHEDGRLENNSGAQAGAGAVAFGLAGAVLGRIWRPVGIGFGVAGAARSTYAQIFGKGIDIAIPANTSLLLDFGRVSQSNTLPKALTQ